MGKPPLNRKAMKAAFVLLFIWLFATTCRDF